VWVQSLLCYASQTALPTTPSFTLQNAKSPNCELNALPSRPLNGSRALQALGVPMWTSKIVAIRIASLSRPRQLRSDGFFTFDQIWQLSRGLTQLNAVWTKRRRTTRPKLVEGISLELIPSSGIVGRHAHKPRIYCSFFIVNYRQQLLIKKFKLLFCVATIMHAEYKRARYKRTFAEVVKSVMTHIAAPPAEVLEEVCLCHHYFSVVCIHESIIAFILFIFTASYC
jgi:hypothetical protein